ncbi:uncharacterized protein LOC131012435 [Salvia miltiorrhiza]|uniref:uncharacterized protein LOC131012435 n=1 Tax=Salvia miltiorrhiza TaxID=226208 RepID=UPI0025AB6057|nr:uncharacterized protein LOC131012435 [Salvia miltiorrhiza]
MLSSLLIFSSLSQFFQKNKKILTGYVAVVVVTGVQHPKMMQSQQRHLLRLSSANFLFPSPPPPFTHHLYFPGRPTNPYPLCSAHNAWVAQLISSQPPPELPIQLPPSVSSLLSASNDSSFQTAASFLITGAFTLFLFRTLRRGAKRAKERRLRSSALETSALKVKGKKRKRPPSADETLLGALIAAAFGILLYKFTTSVEYTLNNQPLSPNYSVRQITITIRTIINGMCYLATFVFGFNSLGLFLYSGQLAMNSFVRVSEDNAHLNSKVESTEDQSSDNTLQK